MNKKRVRRLAIFAILGVIMLSLAGCGARGYNTKYLEAKASTPDKYQTAVDWVEVQIVNVIKSEIINPEINENNNQIVALKALNETETDAGKIAERLAEITRLEARTTELTALTITITDKLLTKNEDYHEEVEKLNNLIVTDDQKNAIKNKVKDIILTYTNFDFIGGVDFETSDYTNINAALRSYVEGQISYNYVIGKEEVVEKSEAQKTFDVAFSALNEDQQSEFRKMIRNYKVNLILADVERFFIIVDNADSFEMLTTGYATKNAEGGDIELPESVKTRNARRGEFETALSSKTGCAMFGGGLQTNKAAEDISNANKANNVTNIYEILATFVVDVEVRLLEQEPLHFTLNSFGEFFSNFFNNFFVFPVGWLLYGISKISGGWYIIGMFITTIIVRTAGWPIYAKTNDMSLKMQVIQPQIQELEAKYANRKDPDSLRMKQAEQAQLYRKNKIGFGGCLMPFLQFPIFMAVYGAIRRLPYTVATAGSRFTLDWASELKPTLFGISFDLYKDYTAGTGQLIGIIVLVILVSGTQFLSQKFSEKRQKQNQQKTQDDVPEYRRQAYKQSANTSQNTMKFVMYGMIVMMAGFVFSSKAGLGIYWLIGNLYSMLQTVINNKLGLKKLEKMRNSNNENKNIITINNAKPVKEKKDKNPKNNKNVISYNDPKNIKSDKKKNKKNKG